MVEHGVPMTNMGEHGAPDTAGSGIGDDVSNICIRIESRHYAKESLVERGVRVPGRRGLEYLGEGG